VIVIDLIGRREEWIKHGTCAGCDETMGSPLLYFQAAVKLRKLFDIDRWVLLVHIA